MNGLLQSLQLFLLAGAAFVCVGSLSAGLITHAMKARIATWAPATRHRMLVLLSALPLLITLGLATAVIAPSLLALVVPGADHCLTHADRHAHLCLRHLPIVALHIVPYVAIHSIILYAASRGLLRAWKVLRVSRLLRRLARTGLVRHDLGATIVEATQPVCFAAGFFAPRIFLSRGLLERLDDGELRIILAHELAHVRRLDALIGALARGLSVLHVSSAARWLTRELAIAAEQACDDEAGGIVGDRLAVAAAILAVERANQYPASREFEGLAIAFGDCAVQRRVESLLVEPRTDGSMRTAVVALLVGATCLLVFADGLHHATESMLSLVVD